MLGTSARSAAVKFSSTYAAGSLRPADGRCRCAPAESRRCPRDDTADFKPRWYTDPFTTPPTPEVQRSRRKRDRRAYGRAHRKLPGGARRQTWFHHDESGSAILGGATGRDSGNLSATSSAGSTKGSSNCAKTPVLLLASVQSGYSTYCCGWRFRRTRASTNLRLPDWTSEPRRAPHAAAPKRPAGSGPAPGRRH